MTEKQRQAQWRKDSAAVRGEPVPKKSSTDRNGEILMSFTTALAIIVSGLPVDNRLKVKARTMVEAHVNSIQNSIFPPEPETHYHRVRRR